MSSTGDRRSTYRPRSWFELMENARVAWRLLRDRRVSPYLRFGLPLVTLLYLLLPIDIMPDILPGLGQVDDLAALWLALSLLLSLAPAEIVQEHREGIRRRAASSTHESVIDGQYKVVD
ncbi:MAG: DUF1232 domain-containing protein [Caldilineae bacterium]|nr:MAG: DUF1232 domain-containing protein [Caldilineae bacterium]